jgi:hypothetical protein
MANSMASPMASPLVRAGLALLACVLFSSCVLVGEASASSHVKATPDSPQRPYVVVVGDSITDLASGPIQSALDSKYQPVLVYRDGQRLDQMLPGLNLALAAHPAVRAVVENLGTNDAIQGGRHADWRASWARLLSSTAKVPCVVLTTINLSSDSYGGRPVASAINREVRKLATSDPTRYKVVDWLGFLKTAWVHHRATFFDYVNRELIHETPAGARWIADEDRSALSDCGSTAQPSIIQPNSSLLAP